MRTLPLLDLEPFFGTSYIAYFVLILQTRLQLGNSCWRAAQCPQEKEEGPWPVALTVQDEVEFRRFLIFRFWFLEVAYSKAQMHSPRSHWRERKLSWAMNVFCQRVLQAPLCESLGKWSFSRLHIHKGPDSFQFFPRSRMDILWRLGFLSARSTHNCWSFRSRHLHRVFQDIDRTTYGIARLH